jgi:hypothetical protein
MSIVTQLPKLYLRGSLANETMANLTKEQREKIDGILMRIINSQSLVTHKQRYTKILRQTIGSDYKSVEAAEQDFMVVVWRGLVMLYCHNDYEFKCRYCKSSTYTNKTGAESEIRKKYEICPNCNADSSVGISPIKVLKINKRHEDPDSVINDENQLSKWFSRQISNATGQQLRENPITHVTRTTQTLDYADKNVTSSLLKILSNHKIRARISSGSNSSRTQIFFDISSVSSKIIGNIIELKSYSVENGVNFEISNVGVEIWRSEHCKFVQMTVTEKTPISMTTESQTSNEEYNILEMSGTTKKMPSIHVSDTIDVILSKCKDDLTKKYAQILMEFGEGYEEYVKAFETKKISYKNLKKMFGISKNKILDMKDEIGEIMYRLGMHKKDY